MSVTFETPAPRRWSTDDVEQRRALSHWVDTVCDRFLALDIDTPLRDRFRARLEQVDLGPATVNVLQADSQRVQRTRAKIANSHTPVFVLLQLRAGQIRARQRGLEVFVRPGESILFDGTQPYELDSPLPTNALAVRMPDQWLKRWIPHPEHFAARVFTGAGWSAALNGALAAIDVGSCDGLALPHAAVAEQIASLMALALGRESAASGSDLLDNLVRTLRLRLAESNLSPQTVAAHHRISKRTLHYAFASAQTTFLAHLTDLRLERAKELLSDPQLAQVSVTDIAARCGFEDPSHFARRFRQKFALSPLQFRASIANARH